MHDYDPMFDEPDQPDPIATTRELADHVGASGDTLANIRRRVYKDTACGASLGILTCEPKWDYDNSAYIGPVYDISLSGYCEGTNAECPTYLFSERTDKDQTWKDWLDATLAQCDRDADDLWNETHND